jgi:hypothetical protein
VTQPEISKWNVAEMAYIGSISTVNQVLVLRKNAPARTIEEMKTITSTVACTAGPRRPTRSPPSRRNIKYIS